MTKIRELLDPAFVPDLWDSLCREIVIRSILDSHRPMTRAQTKIKSDELKKKRCELEREHRTYGDAAKTGSGPHVPSFLSSQKTPDRFRSSGSVLPKKLALKGFRKTKLLSLVVFQGQRVVSFGMSSPRYRP
ncbi:unnamed protein product [Lepeophtheirus salmonis]|uniref:(salmon louse) hypothetical protein n=1 Tax=Lepeophtheirus salmonis TaxID=72036 RepID=A0A7R8H1H7_LEPSM|nr:unnamed protein product [Lepeophtheirus salmonis]CAF2807509.1 unnamed protein product [Lepeophtheirus salmonis]